MKYSIGDRVKITGDFEFPEGTTGRIEKPPTGVLSLVHENEWIGPERNFVTPTGKHKSYWVVFDAPTDDGSGDGPYEGAEISPENLVLLQHSSGSEIIFEDLEELTEKEIVTKKQRKIDKHFSILLNDVKTKIANYRFKLVHDGFCNGKTIELISKLKIPYSSSELNKIDIEHKGSKFEIEGKWINTLYSKGNYIATFLIVSENCNRKECAHEQENE